MDRKSALYGRWSKPRVATVLGGAFLCLALWVAAAAAAEAPSRTLTVAAPAGAPSGVDWVRIQASDGDLLAAVARPAGPGPFPVVVILHGSHGYGRQYVELAKDLARAGFLTLAPCWFSGGGGAGARFIDSIPCPGAPPMPPAASPQAQRTIDALIRGARSLSQVQSDRLALVGHSRGGGAALNFALRGGDVQAVIANSAGYPPDMALEAGQFRPPLLILHGTADAPADGGSAFTDVQMPRNFQAALQGAGKTVEAFYYPGGRHNSLFTDAAQRRDAVDRISSFLKRRFKRQALGSK